MKQLLILLDRVLSRPDYVGKRFEVDNIIFWMERELKLINIYHNNNLAKGEHYV